MNRIYICSDSCSARDYLKDNWGKSSVLEFTDCNSSELSKADEIVAICRSLSELSLADSVCRKLPGKRSMRAVLLGSERRSMSLLHTSFEYSNGRHGKFSRREVELLRCAGKGMSMKETAAAMGISESTLAVYRRSVYLKTGIDSTVRLALYARNVIG